MTSYKRNTLQSNIIDLKNYNSGKKSITSLRKFPGYYEYCIIEDYELKYFDFTSEAVQIQDIFAVLIKVRGKYILSSILFPSSIYNYEKIMSWLDTYNVKFFSSSNFYIENASQIIEGILLENMPIILYRKGYNKIKFNPEDFKDITNEYAQYTQNVDMQDYTALNCENNSENIILNGITIDAMPKIFFNSSKDKILCNGVCLSADYMASFNGNISFFKRGIKHPIAYIKKSNGSIHIDTNEKPDGSVICKIKFTI